MPLCKEIALYRTRLDSLPEANLDVKTNNFEWKQELRGFRNIDDIYTSQN